MTLFIFFSLPALSLGLLYLSKNKHYQLSAVALNIIALYLHYTQQGHQWLATTLTPTLFIVQLLPLVILIFFFATQFKKLVKTKKTLGLISQLAIVFLSFVLFILLYNLSLNYFFLQHRGTKAPLLTLRNTTQSHCNSQFGLYKIHANGDVAMFCPHYYGLMAKINANLSRIQIQSLAIPQSLLNQFKKNKPKITNSE